MYTLDTNILIYLLKDESSVVKFLRENILKGSRFFISSITEIELLSYPKISPDEREKVEDILKTLSIISVDSQLAWLASFFKRKYKTSLPDAIIAATAYLTNSTLLTRNIKHFQKIKEISIKSI